MHIKLNVLVQILCKEVLFVILTCFDLQKSFLAGNIEFLAPKKEVFVKNT